MDELEKVLYYIGDLRYEKAKVLLRTFIDKTAYVVPKCECGSSLVVMGHDPDCWYANCDGCDDAESEGSTPAEAAAAFGEG